MEFDELISIKEEPYSYGYSDDLSGFPEQTLEGDIKVEPYEESECEILDDDGTYKRFKLVPYFEECDVVGQSSWMKEELVWADECETSNLKIDGVLTLDSVASDANVASDPLLPLGNVKPEEIADDQGTSELYVVSESKMESRAQTNVAKKRYACTLCEFECGRLSTVKRHVLNHRKMMKFTCKICSFGCNIESRMELHKMTRHKYVCEPCDIRFKKPSQMKLHLRDFHPVFTCQTCAKTFMEHELFETHVKQCGVKKSPQFLGVKKSPRTYRCNICGYEAENKDKLKMHRLSHPVDKPYACDQCNYRAKTNHLLKIHTRIHTKPHVCQFCKSRFSHPKLLRGHRQKCRSDKVELSCDTCDYRTRFVAQLKLHLMHHSVGDYGCDICEMKFTSVRRLHDHKQTHSADLEPLACKFCDYRCSMVDTLISHSLTHTKKTPEEQV